MLEQDLQGMATTFLVVAGLLTAAALGWAGYPLRGGNGWAPDMAVAPAGHRRDLELVGKGRCATLAVSAGATGWLLPWRDLIAAFIPTETDLLTAAVMLSCLVGTATALTRRATAAA